MDLYQQLPTPRHSQVYGGPRVQALDHPRYRRVPRRGPLEIDPVRHETVPRIYLIPPRSTILADGLPAQVLLAISAACGPNRWASSSGISRVTVIFHFSRARPRLRYRNNIISLCARCLCNKSRNSDPSGVSQVMSSITSQPSAIFGS